MTAFRRDTVGVMPVGALSIGLFHHLTSEARVCDGSVLLLDRPGSASGAALRSAGGVRVRDRDGSVRTLPAETVLGADLTGLLHEARVPEVVMVACNPDQLLPLLSHLVDFVCDGHAVGGLDSLEAWVPLVVLCPNGIYFQRVRLLYIETLEQAVVFGRLPQLWPRYQDRLTDRLMRGVTMQTGVREGSGGDAIYRPGPRGLTLLAGGGAPERARATSCLCARGTLVEDAGDARPTRLEFDKGFINLVSNLLGQILAIDADGRFMPLRVFEIVGGGHEAQTRELARHVVAVGRAVGAYRVDETEDSIHDALIARALVNRHHVPSSLQYVGLMLEADTLRARLTPTEPWLIEPLIRYARSAGIDASVAYFRDLRERVVARLRLAIAARGRGAV